MAVLTVEEFRARLDDSFVAELTSDDAASVDEARCQRAVTDAAAELDGWVLRVPTNLRPSNATRLIHEQKVATYLLTLGRPGKEFEQIRKAYEDTIAFYRGVVGDAAAAQAPSAGAGSAPPTIFDERRHAEFIR